MDTRTKFAMLPMMVALFAACSETDPALTVQEAEAESPQSEIERTVGMAFKLYNSTDISIFHDSQYTLVVRDLIDDDRRKKTGPTNKLYTENVSGISMSDIERSLKNASSWNSWRDNLICLYPNKKEGINYVFNVWSE